MHATNWVLLLQSSKAPWPCHQSMRPHAWIQAYGVLVTAVNVSLMNSQASFEFFWVCLSLCLSHIFSCVAVNCGFPDIPVDSILQLVDSDNPQTLYEDQIEFQCTSEYYILEGDGDYRKLLHIPLFSKLTFKNTKFSTSIYMICSFFQTHTLAMPKVNGNQETARQRCPNALKVWL